MPIILKSGSLNLLEPSRPVQACNGIAFPFPSRLMWKSRVLSSHRLPTLLLTFHDQHSTTFAIKLFSLLGTILWDRNVKEESRLRCRPVKVSTRKNNNLRVTMLLRATNEQDMRGFKRIHNQPSPHKFVYAAPSLL